MGGVYYHLLLNRNKENYKNNLWLLGLVKDWRNNYKKNLQWVVNMKNNSQNMILKGQNTVTLFLSLIGS